MKMKMMGSIYQNNGAGNGMPVEGGRLVNNRPDGMTGIAQLAQAKKAMHREEKVSIVAEGTMLGDMRADMLEGPDMD
jgi:hypothetical protein